MHLVNDVDQHSARPVTGALWYLPLIAASLISAYELGAGHVALAALVAGSLIAFQNRMDRAERAPSPEATNREGASRSMRAKKPAVLDGGSLEHHRRRAGSC